MNDLKLPTFLIIGAMKAGTTTLYRDLLENKAIFFPDDKEPEILSADDVLTEAGLKAYAQLYQDAKPHQARGDASTAYSKLPTVNGVPERALRVLGDDVKIIYIVRHPLERIRSHHHHNFVRGLASADINSEIRTNPEYLAYSRYAMQLLPWIEMFGRDKILPIVLEEYSANRLATAARVFSFLGVPEMDRATWDGSRVFNTAEAQPVASGFWLAVSENRLYRKYLRPRIGVEMRRRVQAALVPKAGERASDIDRETQRYLVSQLEPDIATLHGMLGWSEQRWNLHDGLRADG